MNQQHCSTPCTATCKHCGNLIRHYCRQAKAAQDAQPETRQIAPALAAGDIQQHAYFTTQNLPALLQLLRLQVRHSLPATDNVRIILLPLEQT